MNDFRTLLVGLTGILLVGSASAQEVERHLLRFDFEKGSSGNYVVTQSTTVAMNVTGSIGGKPFERKHATGMSTQMFMHFEVADVTDGRARIRHQITRFSMEFDKAGSSVKVDTANAAAVPKEFAALLDLVGQVTEVEVDSLGHTRGMILPEKLARSLHERSGLDLERVFGQFAALLPEEPIARGGTWTTTMTQPIPQMGELAIAIDNELVDVQDHEVTVHQKMRMGVAGNGKESNLQASYKEGSSRLVVDLRNGVPRVMTMKAVIEMVMENAGVTVDSQTTTEMSLQRVAPSDR